MKLFKPSNSLGTGLLVGIGASLLLPVAARVLSGAGRPLLKEGIKGGLLLKDKGRELYDEARASLSQAASEARSESASAGQSGSGSQTDKTG